MINFSDWLRQMVRYCQLVSENEVLRRAWVGTERSETSVTTYDELIEQIFDDLDADNMVQPVGEAHPDVQRVYRALKKFLSVLSQFDCKVEEGAIPSNPQLLLAQPEWEKVREAAGCVLREAAAVGIGSSHNDEDA